MTHAGKSKAVRGIFYFIVLIIVMIQIYPNFLGDLFQPENIGGDDIHRSIQPSHQASIWGTI